MNFARLNKEIENNKVEIETEAVRDALNEELNALCVDRENLKGKTIKSVSKGFDAFTIIFDDGTYFITEVYQDHDYVSIGFPSMDIHEGVKCGLLSAEKYQVLEDAEKKAKESYQKAYAKRDGVIELNNAIAHLGIDAVKKLVNVKEQK